MLTFILLPQVLAILLGPALTKTDPSTILPIARGAWIWNHPLVSKQHLYPNPCQQLQQNLRGLPFRNCPGTMLPNFSVRRITCLCVQHCGAVDVSERLLRLHFWGWTEWGIRKDQHFLSMGALFGRFLAAGVGKEKSAFWSIGNESKRWFRKSTKNLARKVFRRPAPFAGIRFCRFYLKNKKHNNFSWSRFSWSFGRYRCWYWCTLPWLRNCKTRPWQGGRVWRSTCRKGHDWFHHTLQIWVKASIFWPLIKYSCA